MLITDHAFKAFHFSVKLPNQHFVISSVFLATSLGTFIFLSLPNDTIKRNIINEGCYHTYNKTWMRMTRAITKFFKHIPMIEDVMRSVSSTLMVSDTSWKLRIISEMIYFLCVPCIVGWVKVRLNTERHQLWNKIQRWNTVPYCKKNPEHY